MEDNSWVKVYRKIKEKGWYQNSKYVHLWVHIIFRANHEEKEFMFNGAIHKTKRGEFITGRKALSSETGIAESTIEDILKMFENEGQIRQQKNNRFRLITVLNYEKFQANQQQSNNQPTTSRQPADTNKNLRIKELKNSIGNFVPPTLEEVKAYCLERNNGVNHNKWHDFYFSKGWMVGRNKMKNWQAAVRTWEEKKVVSYTQRELPKNETISDEQRVRNLKKLQEIKQGLNFKAK